MAVHVALEREQWPAAPLRVRVGIHTGEVRSRIGDVFGPDVNLAARIENAAAAGRMRDGTDKVRNAESDKTRRLRISTHVDGYSALAVDTVELEAQKEHEFLQLPVMRPSAVASVTELTRATLNVLVEDLDRGGSPVELNRTVTVWLLARTSAPLAIEDPANGCATRRRSSAPS